jgi:uncharacterized protein YecE (DUF72 family)
VEKSAPAPAPVAAGGQQPVTVVLLALVAVLVLATGYLVVTVSSLKTKVNDLEAEAPFRYVRFRDPPYTDEELEQWAARLCRAREPVYAYFRHEDEPTAPAYAQRLVALLGAEP